MTYKKFDDDIVVSEGDILIEDHTGHWHIQTNESDFSFQYILEIVSIQSDGIVVNGYTYPFQDDSAVTLKYNEELDISSTIQISDGQHFKHTICFSEK